MPEPSPRSEVTRLLAEFGGADADPEVTGRLLELVYGELRGLAGALFRRERADHTLQPTALVHEAYLRLVDQTRVEWQGRAHFLGIAARVMRQVLVDHARKRGALKRGGDLARVTLEEELGAAGHDPVEILDLDDAMQRLAELDPRAARVVELRVFGGLTVKETAEVLGVSPRSVDGDWAMARMWLGRELGPGS